MPFFFPSRHVCVCYVIFIIFLMWDGWIKDKKVFLSLQSQCHFWHKWKEVLSLCLFHVFVCRSHSCLHLFLFNYSSVNCVSDYCHPLVVYEMKPFDFHQLWAACSIMLLTWWDVAVVEAIWICCIQRKRKRIYEWIYNYPINCFYPKKP